MGYEHAAVDSFISLIIFMKIKFPNFKLLYSLKNLVSTFELLGHSISFLILFKNF